MNGTKQFTEDGTPDLREGRGAFLSQRSFDENQGGVIRSENAGMSSVSPGENPGSRILKVSSATSIGGGLVGPNPLSLKDRGDG